MIFKKYLLVFFSIFLLNNCANAQVVFSESFDGDTFVPSGWTFKKTAPNGGTPLDWDRVTAGVNNIPMPHSGVGMARYNSAGSANGSTAEIATPALNLSATGSYRVKFWMYKGDNSLTSYDLLSVYVNSSSTSSVTGINVANLAVSRDLSPREQASGWYQYSFDIYKGPVYYIIFKGTSYGSNNILYIDDITVERFNCNMPQYPSATNLTSTSASIQWYAPSSGTPDKYEYEVRTGGSVGSGNLGLAASGSIPPAQFVNTVSVTGLMQGYLHTIYVRSICGADTSSWTAPVTFTPPCSSASIPYLENFDGALSANGLGLCMKTENYNGNNSSWRKITYPVASAPNAVLAVATGSNGVAGKDFLFTAPLALQAGKCYKVNFSYATNGSTESIEVKYGSTATQAGMTTSLFSRSAFYLPSFQQGSAIFYVPSSGDYYIGFGCTTTVGTGNGLILDDISVTEVCGNVTGINAANITTNSATLNWSAPGCGVVTGYQWELRDTGAVASGAAGLISSGATDATTTSVPCSGLQLGHNYVAYVRANCGNGNLGPWSAPYIFRAACNTVSLPYIQNFDGVVAPAVPDCIFTTDLNGGGFWLTKTNFRPHSAPNCMVYDFASNTGDDWFFLPPINMTAGTSYRLTFYYSATESDEYEALEVKYGNAPSPAAMTSTAVFSNNNITNVAYKQAIIDFTPTATQSYTIGFHDFSIMNQSYFRVDDIVVDSTPLCDSVRQSTAADITPYTANVKWTEPFKGAPASYDWELRSSGNAGSGATGLLSSGTLPSGSLSCPIAGMLPATNYSFYIRSGCDATKGVWVKMNFVTTCLPVHPLYTENFDDAGAPQLPSCTSSENKNNDEYIWRTYANSGYARSQPNLLQYYPNPYAPADDWFYTKPLNLVAGNTYRLTFYYSEYSNTYRGAMEVKLGNYAQSSSMTLATFFSNSNITNTAYQKAEVNFIPAVSGTFYVGFHCISITGQSDIFVDDISIASMGVCPGGNIAIPAGITGAAYQWQVDTTGNGFVNISNNINYSGTNLQSLNINSTPSNFTGYRYRCIVDGAASSVYTLKIYLEWQGSVDNNWHNAANWGGCNVLPDQNTDVLIPAGKAKYPQISANTAVKVLTSENGSTVNVQNGAVLDIKGH